MREPDYRPYLWIWLAVMVVAAYSRWLAALLLVGLLLVYFAVELGWGGGSLYDWEQGTWRGF